MYGVMMRNHPEQISRIHDFEVLLKQLELHPQGQGWPPRVTVKEYTSLIQRLFGAGVTTTLPEYIYWQRHSLGQLLKPTLIELMGEKNTASIMQKHALGD